jgi:uncharacterized protein (DUF58 family)
LHSSPFSIAPRRRLHRWLNRGLAAGRQIELRIGWPLVVLPIVLLNQLLAPHLVWVVLGMTLLGLYVFGYFWVRTQTPVVSLERRRQGAILVAGDTLQEELTLTNDGALPVIWAEFVDRSTVPGYTVGRVVACEGNTTYKWRAAAVCDVRGIYRLGPHLLRLQDPLGLFAVTIDGAFEDTAVIYPRVVQLPPIPLPHGNVQGNEARRRPLLGNLPAATVVEYTPGVSLRNVHWGSTARLGRLMVKELELEPSGNVWIVLDLNREVQQGTGQTGTLEQSVMVAASLAAQLSSGRDQRAVGLMAFSGTGEQGELVVVSPAVGGTHVWTVLTALAPVQTGDVPLAALLATVRSRIGRSGTVTVISAAGAGGHDAREADNWLAELVHLRAQGVESSVVQIQPQEGDDTQADATTAALARQEIAAAVIRAGTRFPALLTFRRRRKVVRSTPTGGVVSYEIEEDVG